jgi:hypothetical protein
VTIHRSSALTVLSLLALACGRGSSVDSPQSNVVSLTATAASASLVGTGDSVTSSLTIANSGTSTQTVQFAPCMHFGPLSLRAYATGVSKPAWDSALDNTGPCFNAIESVDLKPGASHKFLQVNDVNEILGDSLASGTYTLTIAGRNLAPAVVTELGNVTLTLTKHAVAPATFTFTTDSAVYTPAASGTAPFIQYAFTVIARYANTGTTPIALQNSCGPHPIWNIVGAGNNVGVSPYDPGTLCLVQSPALIVAPGAVRVDTIHFQGPTSTSADGTPFGPLYGQFQIVYRAGAGCNAFLSPCVAEGSSVFAVSLPQ